MGGRKVIEIKNLTAGYGGENVLKNLNFNINNNENLGIIGPNGCGKTTFLRVISGNLPFKGEVLIDGISIKKYKSKALAKKISMLSQITQAYFNYSVMETVLMGRFAHQQGLFSSITQNDKELAVDALKLVGMSHYENKGINTLSGGQMQRVFLAKVICQNPDYVLLDEPTNHLDLSYQAELGDFLVDWSKSQKKCLIGVFHDFNIAVKISDKLLLLNSGEKIIMDDVKKVVASKELSTAYGIDVKNYMIQNLKMWENM